MSDKCNYPSCGKDLVHVEGRRKKKFCSDKCRTAEFQTRNKGKKRKMKCIPVEEFKKLSDVVEVKGDFELGGYTFMVQRCEALEDTKFRDKLIMVTQDDRGNPIINIARGRESDGTNPDELNSTLKSTNSKKENESKGSFENESPLEPVWDRKEKWGDFVNRKNEWHKKYGK